MKETPKHAVVIVVTLMTVLGMVAPVAGVTSSGAGVESGGADDAFPSTTEETSDHVEDTTSDTKSMDRTNTATISGTLRMQMESADDEEQLPVIVVFEKRPQDEFDLQGLDDATARDKLQTLAARQQSRAKSYLQEQRERNRAGKVQTLWSTNSMAVRATDDTIEGLAGLPNVKRIVYDQKVSKADEESGPFAEIISEYGNTTATPTGFDESTTGDPAWSPEYIGADAVKERGVKGDGVNVSVVDTGIDAEHPALEGAVTEWKDFTPDNYTRPVDPDGHGTHVAGTIAARPAGDRAVGVAPEANLFGAKVFSDDPDTPTRVSDIVTAFEWSANNSADVISASIGVPPHFDEYSGDTTLGDDAQAANDVRIYANASGSVSTNFSTDAYKPAYVLVSVEPVAVNGTSIQNDSHRAAVMANMSVTLQDPSGEASLRGVNATWVFENGEVPDQITLRKYKPTDSTPLTQNGNWTLSVESQTGKNVTYSYSAVPVYPSNGSDALAESINTVSTTYDVSTVIAGGNYGFELGNRSISSPGVAAEAITVGAAGHRTNDVTVFSSRGPVGYGADERPGIDVIAPGEDVVSTVPTHYDPNTDANYGYSSGTSMAAPHVSGTLALMLSADPSQSPDELEQTLEATAQDVPRGENAVGAGVIDAYRAVNASNASALGPETSEDGRHTLFAGLGNTENGYIDVSVSPHEDPSGDAGTAPDIWMTNRLVAQGFKLATHDETALNATFRLYIDADQNDSTGDAAQGGAEYMVRLNRTLNEFTGEIVLSATATEYDATTGEYEVTSNLSVSGLVNPTDARFIETTDLDFANREDTKPFDWHVTSAELGAEPGDRFPNTGQATHGAAVTVNGTAVAWNATAGQPDTGEPVTFRVYNDSGGLVSAETVQTNAEGRASVNTPIRLVDEFENGWTLEINDTYGNEVRQYLNVEQSCVHCALSSDTEQTQSSPGYTVTERDYEINQNETLTLNIPVYNDSGDSLTPYTGNASIQLYDYSESIVINDIKVDDGVIRTQVNFSNETIDDGEYPPYLDIRVALSSDFQAASQYTEAGYINIESSNVDTRVGPQTTTVPADGSTTMVFQNTEQRTDDPVNTSVEYEVEWVTDRNVASLYAELSDDLVNRLQEGRFTGGNGTEPLSTAEYREIRQAMENLSTQGVSQKITRGSATPTAHGVGEFDVSPPEDARFGIVSVRPNGSDYFQGYSRVYVEDRVNAYSDDQTEPSEDQRYSLQVDGYWPTVVDNGTGVLAENVTVEVSLWDDEANEYVDNATVNLYTTFGQTISVTTSDTGPVEVTISAGDRDWRNVSHDMRDQEILGVAEGYNTPDGKPLSESETVYGNVFDFDNQPTGTEAVPQLSYEGDGRLQTTLRFRNRTTGDLTTGNRTLVVLTRGSQYQSTGDIKVGFVDPGESSSVTFNATDPDHPSTDESQQYAVGAGTADQTSPNVDYGYARGATVLVDEPPTIIDGETTTVSFTVVDRNGDPIENAVVKWQYSIARYVEGDYEQEGTSTTFDGGAQVVRTDSNGKASIEVTPEIPESVDSEFLYYEVGVATQNESVQYARGGGIQVEQPQGNVSGRIVYPNGSTVAGDVVAAFDYGTYDRTDENGQFAVSVGSGDSDIVFYQSHDDDGPGALDGVPDVYAIKEVTGKTDLSDVELPDAHRLNVTVVDEQGNPVENANVTVRHRRNGAEGGGVLQTNADGQAMIADRVGVEVNGSIIVEATPPENATRFADGPFVRTVDVTGDDEVTVTLEDRPRIEGRIVYQGGTTVANDTVVARGYEAFDRTNESGNFEIPVGEGSSDVVFYQTSDGWEPGAPDDVPDVYAIDEVDGATDFGNITLPEAHRLNVTVVDESGDPVEHARVGVAHTRNDAVGGGILSTNAAGMLEIDNRTGVEVVGNVTLLIRPPEGSDRFTEQNLTRNLTVTADNETTVTLEERQKVEGRIVYPNGTTQGGDQIVDWTKNWSEWTSTASNGSFEVVIEGDRAHVAFWQRHDPDPGIPGPGPGPIDDVPDAYAIGVFNNSTDLGNVTLPEAHRLNVTVVTENGEPVKGAFISAGHERNNASIHLNNWTKADGRYRIGGRVGIELTGNVSVRVQPPEDATGLANETKHRNLTLTEDRNITVTLNTTEVRTGAELVPNESETAIGGTTTYDVVVTDATGGVGAYEGNVSLGNGTVAVIDTVELHGDPGLETVNVSADGTSVAFTGALADTNDSGRVTIATVTVRGETPGSTAVDLSVDALGTESGVGYNVTATTGATLNVTEIGTLRDAYAGPPTDVDGDGVYEDINGDGNFTIADVQALYTVYDDEVVENNPEVFDINGENGVNIVDVQALYVEYQEEKR